MGVTFKSLPGKALSSFGRRYFFLPSESKDFLERLFNAPGSGESSFGVITADFRGDVDETARINHKIRRIENAPRRNLPGVPLGLD